MNQSRSKEGLEVKSWHWRYSDTVDSLGSISSFIQKTNVGLPLFHWIAKTFLLLHVGVDVLVLIRNFWLYNISATLFGKTVLNWHIAQCGHHGWTGLSSWLFLWNVCRKTIHQNDHLVDNCGNNDIIVHNILCHTKSQSSIKELINWWIVDVGQLDTVCGHAVLCQNNDHTGVVWYQFSNWNVLGWNANTVWRSTWSTSSLSTNWSDKYLQTILKNA